MKTSRFFLIVLVVSAILNGCGSDPENDLSGLVSFASEPSYANDALTFEAQIQFGFAGEAVEVEYKIMSADSEIFSGSATANNNPDGMGLWFETAPVSYSLPSSQYSGQTITVYLDPDNKITSKEYTTETYVNLYKKSTITIP